MRAPGKIEPVIYFVCGEPSLTNPPRPKGYVLIAPYTACPTPEGYRRECAETLAEVDKLEAKLIQQEYENTEREAESYQAAMAPIEKSIQDKLYQHMISSETDSYNKEFYRLYLQLRDERKREKYRQLFLERTMFLWAKHYDTPKGRGVDEEKVNLDRLEIR